MYKSTHGQSGKHSKCYEVSILIATEPFIKVMSNECFLAFC